MVLKHPACDNDLKKSLKTITGCNLFSARTGLVFKSSETLRHLEGLS